MHLSGVGKNPRHVYYLPFDAHKELMGLFTNQHRKLSISVLLDYALVFLYTMPNEAEAFWCLENLVAKCPAYLEPDEPGDKRGGKV
jgi:hypothetical protein